MLALTDENDWVFDPYAGVASALIAAIKRNRRALGSEQEADYIEIGRERINAFFNGTLQIRPMGKPVYKPTGKEKVAQVPLEWKKARQKRLLEKSEVYGDESNPPVPLVLVGVEP